MYMEMKLLYLPKYKTQENWDLIYQFNVSKYLKFSYLDLSFFPKNATDIFFTLFLTFSMNCKEFI